MRRAIPEGWTPKPDAVRIFEEAPERWLRIVRSQVRRYGDDPYLERSDMESEGAMLALYAIQEYRNRPNVKTIDGLIAAMVRCYLRDRVVAVRNERRRLVSLNGLQLPIAAPRQPRAWAWSDFIQWRERQRGFWKELSPCDRGVLYLRIAPPPELVVLDRNLLARVRRRVSREAIALFTGLTIDQVRRSLSRSRGLAAVTLDVRTSGGTDD